MNLENLAKSVGSSKKISNTCIFMLVFIFSNTVVPTLAKKNLHQRELLTCFEKNFNVEGKE